MLAQLASLWCVPTDRSCTEYAFTLLCIHNISYSSTEGAPVRMTWSRREEENLSWVFRLLCVGWFACCAVCVHCARKIEGCTAHTEYWNSVSTNLLYCCTSAPAHTIQPEITAILYVQYYNTDVLQQSTTSAADIPASHTRWGWRVLSTLYSYRYIGMGKLYDGGDDVYEKTSL